MAKREEIESELEIIFDRLYRDNISRFVAFSRYRIPLYSLYNREKSEGHSFGYSYNTFGLFLTWYQSIF